MHVTVFHIQQCFIVLPTVNLALAVRDCDPLLMRNGEVELAEAVQL